ncbi:MAG: FxsA family protein, partial [Acidimicrobiales bacterium]
MLGILVVLFLMLPIIELYIIVQVAGSMGVLNTIGLLIVVSVVGAWLVRRQGLGVLGRVQAQLAEGRLPGK